MQGALDLAQPPYVPPARAEAAAAAVAAIRLYGRCGCH
jgi:hypothetical protein